MSDEKLSWKAKVFWSSRTWESTIVEQVPDEHIVWRSKGPKGHVDGTVSFHELAPNLRVFIADMDGVIYGESTIGDLLPNCFTPGKLKA